MTFSQNKRRYVYSTDQFPLYNGVEQSVSHIVTVIHTDVTQSMHHLSVFLWYHLPRGDLIPVSARKYKNTDHAIIRRE
jgi:hypothetical protein